MAVNQNGQSTEQRRRADVCGIAANGAGFLVTDGNGVVSQFEAGKLIRLARHVLAWDNHLVPVKPFG